MSKILPPEIIRPIVLCLKDDKRYLYSCLLVSRDWCRETIDLLWKKPFHFLYACSKATSSMLDFKSNHCSMMKRQSQATILLIIYLSIKYNDELVKEGIIKKNLMFNYLEFLSALDLYELYNAIRDLSLHFTKDNDNKSSIQDFLITKLNLKNLNEIWRNMFEFLFTHSPKLRSLSFDSGFILHRFNYDNNNNNSCLKKDFCDHTRAKKILLYGLEKPEFKQIFANLTELVFTTDVETEPSFSMGVDKIRLLSNLSQICHNIQTMIVSVKFEIPYDICFPPTITSASMVEGGQLAPLIRSQKNLVYFELVNTAYEGDEYANDILEALKETSSLKTFIANGKFVVGDNNSFYFT